MKKQNRAITLIALIITIVVLLILAGVVINLTMGDNGIIGKVQTAVGKYQNAQEMEEYQIAQYSDEITSHVNGNRDEEIIKLEDINKILNRISTLEDEVTSLNNQLTTLNNSLSLKNRYNNKK